MTRSHVFRILWHSTLGFRVQCVLLVEWLNRALHAHTSGFAVYTSSVNNIVYRAVPTVIKLILLSTTCVLAVPHFSVGFPMCTGPCGSFPELLPSPLQYQCTSRCCHSINIELFTDRSTAGTRTYFKLSKIFVWISIVAFLHFTTTFLPEDHSDWVDCVFTAWHALLFVSGQKVRCGQSATTQLILLTGVMLLLRGICDIGFRACAGSETRYVSVK